MLIIGAKGFAKELFEAVLQNGNEANVAFYDDISSDLPQLLFGRYRILKTESEAQIYFGHESNMFALGVGNPIIRKRLSEKFCEFGGKLATIVSPFAKIGSVDNLIGEGSCVLTDAIIESSNRIGVGSLIHAGVLISHDVVVGNFCEVSPRANLLGGAAIGELCSIGTGAIVLPRVKIGNNAIIGAGAVVTKDVPANTIVVGNPSRPLSK